jgi:hypothetical protein
MQRVAGMSIRMKGFLDLFCGARFVAMQSGHGGQGLERVLV